ncbi:hypothetical protein BJV78DRAFT_53550 [Lactifluus subvellereus]|nr:hypothetical protein BJV78DRAFT_53550 [Lactifluus subvellereus]
MLIQLTSKLVITLLFSITILLAFAGSSSANGISSDSAHRRSHANLGRMIKMRVGVPAVARQLVGAEPVVNSATASPPAAKASTSASSSISSSSAPPASSATPRPSPVLPVQVSSSSPPALAPSSSVVSSVYPYPCPALAWLSQVAQPPPPPPQ